MWTCNRPGCRETLSFTQEDGHVIAFLIMHHLVRKHGLGKSAVLKHDPRLAKAADEYLDFPR